MANKYKTAFFVAAAILVGIFVFNMSTKGTLLSATPFAAAPAGTPVEVQTASGTTTASPLLIQDVSCDTAQASATYNGLDLLEAGTTANLIGRAAKVSADGTYKLSAAALTTLSPNQDYAFLLVNDTDYHNAFVPKCKVPCSGEFAIASDCGSAYKGSIENATVTITVFNENADVISNATRVGEIGAHSAANAVTNQTSKGVGASYNFKVKLDGEDKASTGEMTCLIESTNKTATRDIVWAGSGVKKASIPRFYGQQGASSETYAFDVSAIEGAVTQEHNIQVLTETGENLGDSVGTVFLFNCFTKEWFEDTDGVARYAVENGNGAAQSMARYQTSWGIN